MFVVILKYNNDTFNSNASSINESNIQKAKKHAKGEAKHFKKMRSKQQLKVLYVTKQFFIATPGGVTLKVKWATVVNTEQSFAELIIMFVDFKARSQMARALIDMACSKSIILKEFTNHKHWIKLKQKDQVQYQTYNGEFQASIKASMGF